MSLSPTIDALITSVIPGLFCDTRELVNYGQINGLSETIAQTTQLMQVSSVSKLAGQINLIIQFMKAADPKRIAIKSSWFARFTGANLERRVRFEVAKVSLDELIEQAGVTSKTVSEAITAMDSLINQNREQTEELRTYIEAGKQYLQANPQDQASQQAEHLSFENPHERFARRLSNLSALLASHEMSVIQLRLVRAQAIDLLDRFVETTTVLIPVWQQHKVALSSATTLDPAMVAAATKAHDALQLSLANSVASFNRKSI
jgi:uncharacterized protein YaaN involved in tellurite resistance